MEQFLAAAACERAPTRSGCTGRPGAGLRRHGAQASRAGIQGRYYSRKLIGRLATIGTRQRGSDLSLRPICRTAARL